MFPGPEGSVLRRSPRRVVGDEEEGSFDLGDERVCAAWGAGHGVTVLCAGHNLVAAGSAAWDRQVHPVSRAGTI